MEMNHILVVEDDKEIREGVKIYLQSQGYEVFLAADGIEGLEVMEKEDIHLAIVDTGRRTSASVFWCPRCQMRSPPVRRLPWG